MIKSCLSFFFQDKDSIVKDKKMMINLMGILKFSLENCIEALPDKYALVFRMKTIQQFETEDICKELDITSSNLWVIIHRARTQLRKCMEESWFKN